MGIKNVELLIKHDDSTNNNQQKDDKQMEPTHHGVEQTGRSEDLVDHEQGVRDTVDSELEDLSTQEAIADAEITSGGYSAPDSLTDAGSSYSQSETNTSRTAINAINSQTVNITTDVATLGYTVNGILQVLRDAKLIPTE